MPQVMFICEGLNVQADRIRGERGGTLRLAGTEYQETSHTVSLFYGTEWLARARAVMDWLTKHSIPANRLSAKGYGKTKPVADNGSDEDRAKNRRVEIANPACTSALEK